MIPADGTSRWPAAPTPADVALVAVALLLAAALFLAGRQGSQVPPTSATLEGAGAVRKLRLDSRRQLEVEGPLGISRIEVEAGRARIAASPCRQQICVHRGWLTRAGDLAACVPNRILLRVHGDVSRFDGVSR